MNKTILYTAMLALLSTSIHAENATENAEIPATAPSSQNAQPGQPAQTGQPSQSAQPNQADQPDLSTQIINCDHKIPPEKKEIAPSLIKTWVQYATVEAFDMNAAGLDEEMETLQKCFTKQGWEGFNAALKESGNLDAIKEQNLTVTSQVDGEVTLESIKENEWKATLPLNVVYQNDKQKLNQLLSVDVLIGRKVSGDLGIMQIIATPRVAQPSDAASPNNNQAPASGASEEGNPPASTQEQTAP